MKATATNPTATDFRKVCRVASSPDTGNVFIKIGFTAGKLSISGVEGPLASGNARGSCGQIATGYAHRNPADNDSRYSKPKKFRSNQFADGWDSEKWLDLLDIWKRWHLNDMKANCEHQVGPEWESKEITLYHFRLAPHVVEARKDAVKRVQKCLETGEPFTPTTDEVARANMKESLTLDTPDAPAGYVPNGPRYENDHYNRASETKRSGWVKPSEHPKGILCKPCAVCGYKYGTEWKSEEVPAEVLEFLRSLPDADTKPAWV